MSPRTAGVVLVTGATGNVGTVVTRGLRERGVAVRGAVTTAAGCARLADGVAPVVFDFADPSTFDAALADVDRVFLMRPPHMADVSAFRPFVAAMCAADIRQVVFLSLQGVAVNPIVPHHGIEKLLRASRLPWTFLRPSFYMQNLSGTHSADIRERDEIFVPAGGGRTSLIDVRDIGEAAAVVLTAPGHVGAAYEITGGAALTYDQCAATLTSVLGRPIRYTRPSGRAFAQRMAEQGVSPDFVTVMRGIYLAAKLGLAAGITDELPRLIGREPITFERFVEDHASVWSRASFDGE